MTSTASSIDTPRVTASSVIATLSPGRRASATRTIPSGEQVVALASMNHAERFPDFKVKSPRWTLWARRWSRRAGNSQVGSSVPEVETSDMAATVRPVPHSLP